MSAMANTTHIVTTVTKPATNPRDADGTPRVNIQDFCKEYYEDIIPIIMDKVRRDKRKKVHARLDFGEGSREKRTREDSHHSSHQRQSAFDRLSETYSPSTTKSRPGRKNSRDHPRGRSRPRKLDTSNEDCPEDRERFRGVRESYDDSYSHSYHDRDRSSHMKRIRDNESPLSSVSKSDSSDGRYRKSRSKRQKPTDEDDLTRPWMCEEEDPFTPRIRNFESLRRTRMSNKVKTYDGTGDPKDHVKIFQEATQVEHWAMPTWCHMFNSTLIGAARVWFDELPPDSVDSYKDLKAATSQKGKLQEKGLTFGVIQGKEGGPVSSPPYKDAKRNSCDRGSTDECMQLKKQIKELVRAGKLSHLIKELKHGRDQSKAGKKEIPAKDKPAEIYMIQSWQIMTRQKVTQSFRRVREITFPPLPTSSEPLGQLRLLVTIGDADHSTRAWMNFMIVRSLSPYNGIIRKPGIREIQAVPSTAHRMLKFPVDGGIVTIRSTILIPAECTMVITSSVVPKEVGARTKNFESRPTSGLSQSGSSNRRNVIGKRTHQTMLNHEEELGYIRMATIRHDRIMVTKHDGSWQRCVDFTDLNKVCPQDCYPLPEIEWKVKSLCGYHFKCFLEAYTGYQQIQLAKPDEEKTAFHTSQGPNWSNIEVYVDDLVVKSHTETEMLRDIDETFRTLRKINMKLNLKKCTFGAVEGVFLGYVVTLEGIKPCFDKTAAVLQLPSLQTIKEVQSLNGKLASLNRFLSKSAAKSLPLFKTLKKCIKKSDFHWTSEAKQAFKQLKQHLSELPLLVVPKPKEELIVYLSATYGAISAVLMTKRGAIQTRVYFISRALQGPELNYTPMEKLVMSLVFTTKRLRRYFQAHPIAVITDQPIKKIMSRPDVAARLQKWSVMLGEHNIMYRPKTSVKGQVLGDFLTEMSDENPPAALGRISTRAFAASNNEAEYEALIAGLQIAAQMGVQNVHVSVDSKLVANQFLGTYVAKEENMIKYLEKVKSLVSGFTNFSISQVPQRKKKKADALSKIASTSFAHLSKQAEYMIREIHEGSCSMHERPRSVVAKSIRLGYYWLTMHQDARDMIRTCNDCQWGIDIAGPFPEGPGKVKFLIVAIDYFTKWIEEKSVATITGSQVEELPHVLWAHCTMIKSSHGDTPFSLTYGTEAVIPIEIGMPMYRTAVVDVVYNDEELRLNLDLLEERRERAAIREAKAKLKMTKYYNARVRGVTFRPGDFVYRSNNGSHAVKGGKLRAKWEGPYEMEHINYDLRTDQFFQGRGTSPILKDVTSESRLTHGFQLQLGLENKVIHVILSFYS
uniref:Reverse transcriptase domain-containing protein n=1 Tax=Tanacetum cinerariifolium TaxID=118510 RepID=A0A6L2MEM9_TANCI|nr:reverse transcriptase domain-containing protein [Tanacetum cinerariifolium]